MAWITDKKRPLAAFFFSFQSRVALAGAGGLLASEQVQLADHPWVLRPLAFQPRVVRLVQLQDAARIIGQGLVAQVGVGIGRTVASYWNALCG